MQPVHSNYFLITLVRLWPLKYNVWLQGWVRNLKFDEKIGENVWITRIIVFHKRLNYNLYSILQNIVHECCNKWLLIKKLIRLYGLIVIYKHWKLSDLNLWNVIGVRSQSDHICYAIYNGYKAISSDHIDYLPLIINSIRFFSIKVWYTRT